MKQSIPFHVRFVDSETITITANVTATRTATMIELTCDICGHKAEWIHEGGLTTCDQHKERV